MLPGLLRRVAAAPARQRGAGRGLLRASGGLGPGCFRSRWQLFKPSGAILPRPIKMPFGLLRVFSVVITFITLGVFISKNIATLLDQHDIFSPDDDDDDF